MIFHRMHVFTHHCLHISSRREDRTSIALLTLPVQVFHPKLNIRLSFKMIVKVTFVRRREKLKIKKKKKKTLFFLEEREIYWENAG